MSNTEILTPRLRMDTFVIVSGYRLDVYREKIYSRWFTVKCPSKDSFSALPGCEMHIQKLGIIHVNNLLSLLEPVRVNVRGNTRRRLCHIRSPCLDMDAISVERCDTLVLEFYIEIHVARVRIWSRPFIRKSG